MKLVISGTNDKTSSAGRQKKQGRQDRRSDIGGGRILQNSELKSISRLSAASEQASSYGSLSASKNSFSPSFGASAGTIITSAADKAVISLFSQNYGSIGERIGEKLHKLTSESEILQRSSRFTTENGALLIREKKAGRQLFESLIFPFVNLPLNAASYVLKKAQEFPSLKEKARQLYNTPFLRVSRKSNELDSKTDILKGILDKTREIAADFAKENGIDEKNIDKLIEAAADSKKYPELQKYVPDLNKYLKENLYKAGSKFFDKHTGNFNTAHERPLNRIITGLIPVGFLANDAYNLSVLCGDSKEESEKEAAARKKQELIRIFTTAYIQLMIFGAFTKQVNTIPWFAPVTSAATVLVSEIFSRKKLNKPVFFLSKEAAMEYNRKNGADKEKQKSSETSKPYMDFREDSKIFKGFNKNQDITASNKKNGASFGAGNAGEKDKKESAPKALINFSTFKKGVIYFTSFFLALSFIKNSSLTKNSKLVKGISDFGSSLKKNFYDRYAYKDFQMTSEQFTGITGALKQAGCGKIAEGHEFIQGMYAKETSKGVFKMYKSVISASGVKKVSHTASEYAQSIGVSAADTGIIEQAVKTALDLSSSSIAENKYDTAAKKAVEIIKNKKIGLNDEQTQSLVKNISDSIAANVKETPVKIDSKIKPYIDIAVEPFKFIWASVKLPFRLLHSAVNMITAPVQKKAAKAALGKAELTDFERAVNKTVTEIFGGKSKKSDKISQTIFANAMEQLEKKTLPYRTAQEAYEKAKKAGAGAEELSKLKQAADKAREKLALYVDTAAGKSFNGVTQSSNKNTDLALMSKLASSTVTSAFLVADNYNMVMLKSDGRDKDGASEKANERIIQRLSGLFYQALFINWFNQTFRSTYNSSLAGMAAVAVPNTLTTEILTRKSIGMPIRKKTLDELNKIEEQNENQKGLKGRYFKFMRLLTGKKPLKDRLPKNKQKLAAKNTPAVPAKTAAAVPSGRAYSGIKTGRTTNFIELLEKNQHS